MSTDTLDERIRRAVHQVAESSPPAPPLNRPFASLEPHRRRRRLTVVALSFVLVLMIVLAGVFLVGAGNRPLQPGGSAGEGLDGYLDVVTGPGIRLGRDVYTVGAGRVRVRFSGATGHTFVIDDPRVHMLLGSDPTAKHVAIVTLHPGTYTIGDSVPGHRAQGEVATLHVLRQPVHWVTPSGSTTALTLPDATTPVDAGTSRAAGRALSREIRQRVPWVTATSPSLDLRGFAPFDRVGRVVVEANGPIDATVYRLPEPVALDALTADADATLTTTRAGSQLVESAAGSDVFLVRRDATVLHLSAVGAPNPALILELARRLDRPETSAALP